jgi:hypothetical protein
MTRRPPPSLALPRPRRPRGALWISLAVHAAILALALWHGPRLWSRAAAPGAPLLSLGGGGGGGGGGGSRVAYINLPSAPAPAAKAPTKVPPPAPPPKPRPVVVKPVPPPPPPAPPEPAESTADSGGPAGDSTLASADTGPGDGPGTGGGTGGGEGTGTGTGTGPGNGPGAGGGNGTIVPPQIRVFSLPLDKPPKELRGSTIEVTWWVTADGRVDRVATRPEIRDEDYRRKFLEIQYATRFRPARSPSGGPVPATLSATYTLPTK